MNKENCALKLVDEIILYYDARSKKHQIHSRVNGNGMKYEQMRLALSENNFKENILLHTLHISFFISIFVNKKTKAFERGGARPMCHNKSYRTTHRVRINFASDTTF